MKTRTRLEEERRRDSRNFLPLNLHSSVNLEARLSGFVTTEVTPPPLSLCVHCCPPMINKLVGIAELTVVCARAEDC